MILNNETDPIYRRQNFGNRIGFGRRSALLLVNFTAGFNDPMLFGGGNIDAAVKRSVALLEFFRKHALPVAFTRVVYAEDGSDAGVFCLKAPNLRMLTETHPAGQMYGCVRPGSDFGNR
jgi:maleamate amidohydrolase